MKLRSLRVNGFKSFADRTEIEFHEGMTAIVGPNGCGKSNISDAIRWVLGEQRPTAIRGAKMEEAIFQGTVHRKPVNRGTVTMTVSNEDGLLAVPFEEVEIGRTVFRDGGSDYSINRSACRLKDVVELCRDTGLGANAYSVIEQRMIDAILSDRADERRGLFEEAAGIGKYKDRRKAATRRLERAELDLQRLEDVIAEVETKVRSLARQKGKAQRYQSLRERRLAVEVAVVGHQLTELQSRFEEVEVALGGEQGSEEGLLAELRAAELRVERLRLRQVELDKARSESAAVLDDVRIQLVRWERDLAVADERAAYAERRLAQILDERTESQNRVHGLETEERTLSSLARDLEAEAAEARSAQQASQAATQEVRTRLAEARESLQSVEAREREVARKGAQLDGDADAAEAQAAELARRLERLHEDLEAAADALSDLEAQGDLFADQIASLQQGEDAARGTVDGMATALEAARATFDEARSAELEHADRAAALAAELAALDRMERDREGVEPAAREAAASVGAGVLGPLADFLEVDAEHAMAVEAHLGMLLRGLVVKNRAAAVKVARWFKDEWQDGGGLILLPLDTVPEAAGALPDGVRGQGAGAPWVDALLGGVALEADEGDLIAEEGWRIARSGLSMDRMGIVRVGNPSGGTGVLERRSRLESLRPLTDEARARAGSAREAREEAERRLRAAEQALDHARAGLRRAEDAHREAGAEVAAQTDRKSRMDRHRDELARQLEGTRAARVRALERAGAAREDRAALSEEEESLQGHRDVARAALSAVEEEWEAARSEESRFTVELTRLQGELGRVRERTGDAARSRDAALARIEALDNEEQALRTELAEVGHLRREGEGATEELFKARTLAEAELGEKDRAVHAVADELDREERAVRTARTAEREATTRRHRLELERQELIGNIGRIQERLEGEWGRPLQTLLDEAEPVAGDPEELAAELREIVQALERIGPVNMLAVEEHEEESTRLAFLTEQRDDLISARDDLRSAIKQINETATTLFLDTFRQIQENFASTFRRLFEGGEAALWLSDDDDPLEASVEIHASPRGKKTQRIDLLSGGERALTALSLLFGIYLVKPSPFCVLDEVDAPLDEANIGRFINLLQQFKRDTQFVVITHNPRTIEAADWIYGVTMEEPGVSSIVGVRLEDALQASGSAA
jgi:chromosome segregation protein